MSRKRLFEFRNYSFQGSEFVGNGLDRSGIVADIAILNKIIIEYNIHKSEPEQASLFPTPTFRVSSIPNYLNSKLKTLHSPLSTLNSPLSLPAVPAELRACTKALLGADPLCPYPPHGL